MWETKRHTSKHGQCDRCISGLDASLIRLSVYLTDCLSNRLTIELFNSLSIEICWTDRLAVYPARVELITRSLDRSIVDRHVSRARERDRHTD